LIGLLGEDHIIGLLGIPGGGEGHFFLPVDNVGIAFLIHAADIPGIDLPIAQT